MPKQKNEARTGLPTTRSNLTISFGLVNVTVGTAPLMGADKTPSAKLLCPEHHVPVKQRYVCDHGDSYSMGECDRGFEYADTFVRFSPDELKDLEARSNKIIELTACVPVEEIDPIYYESSYTIWPSTEASKVPFDLLVTSLRETGQALVGSAVMGKTPRTLVLRFSPALGVPVLHVCRHEANIRATDVGMIREYMDGRPEAAQEALSLVGTLLASLGADFNPEAVEDAYTRSVEAAIEARANGQGLEVADNEALVDNTPDLIENLRLMLAEKAAEREAA